MSRPGPGATKAEWRRWARQLPDPADTAAVLDGLRHFLGDSPGTVAAYEVLPGEVDLGPLLEELDAVVLPVVDDDALRWEPTAAPDVVLVPGRIFDRHGYRLGRGGGHYDRTLQGIRGDVVVVGVCVEARVVEALPSEPHDIPMTHLATERGVYSV